MKGCQPSTKCAAPRPQREVKTPFASLFTILASLWLLPGVGVTSVQGVPPGLFLEGSANGRGVVNFSELAGQEASARANGRLRPHPIKRKPQARTFSAASAPTSDAAPADSDVWFTAASVPPSPPASASFMALPDNAVAFNPDTAGAVGPNHLLVVLESEMRVQNRSGGVLSTVSVDTFWGTLGNSNVFDTRVIYDSARQRWITTAIANPATNGSSLLIAVSQTNDPTGNWYRQRIQTDLVNGVYPDSPNIGLARDWVVVTANMMNQSGLFYESIGIFAFNRTNLYAGGQQVWQQNYAPNGSVLGEVNIPVPAVSYDENNPTNFMVANWDGSFGGGAGRLRLFSVSGPVNAPVFNDYSDAPAGGLFAMAGAAFGSPSWVSAVPGTINFAPQLGTTNKIFIGDARIQNVVYRNGALWCAQHVFLPTNLVTRCAVQWWSLTSGGTVIQHGRVDDPTGAKFYAYPSIGVNRYEDVLIGYSRFAANQFPSANYSFHGYQAGPGQLLTDTVLKSGEAKFAVADDGFILWGDWSATMVDPVNDTDLWTIQEYAATPAGGSDRWSTWWGRVSPPTSLSLSVTDSPDPVIATSNVTYSIRVTNNTTHIATGVRVTNTLPIGAVYVSAQSSQGGCLYTNGVVTCDFGDVAGDLNSNVVVTATVVARLNQGGTATNTVTASSFGPDDFPADNTVKVLTSVTTAADLALTLAAAPSPVILSNNVTYSLTVTNRGPSPATAVSLTNTLPAGVAYVSASSSQGTCSQVGSIVTCSLGTLASNAGVTVTIVGRANVSGSQTNRAIVGSTALDVNPANSSASIVVRASAAPVLQTILPRTINEDTTLGPISFTVSDLETPADALVLTAASSNPSVVPTNNIFFGGAGTDRNITVTPAPNANGTVNIWRILTDGDGIATSNFFTLTITADNDPPTISDITNQVANEDTVIGPINFTVGDVESGAAALNVSGASSNPTLIPNANLVFGGAGSTRNLTVRPATNQFGTALITVTVSDGSITTNDTFQVTILSVNDLPTITDITNRVVNEDTSVTAGFIIGDVETSVAALTLIGTSSNPALVPNGSTNISFGGTGSSRTVTVTPVANQTGTTTITVFVIDTDNGTNSDSFLLTVNAVNDPPTLNFINSITINEDSGPTNITLTGISSGATNEFQNLMITAKSDKPFLLPHPTVVSNSPTTAILTLAPVANSNGIATVTVSIDDGGVSNNTVSRQFTVTIREVNDPPVISRIDDLTINEDSSTNVSFTIGDVESPVAALSVFTRSSNTTLIPDANVVLGGTLSNRNVTISPAANQSGRATITVFVSDGAATNSQAFTVTVLQVNDPPTISAITNRTILEDTSVTIDFTIGDLETPLTNLGLTATSSNLLLTPNISFGGSGSNRTVTILPGTNLSGSANITLAVIDSDGASNTTSFVLTVLPVDDPPTIDPVSNVSIPEDSPLQTVLLTGISSGASNEFQTLRVSAVSGNAALIRDPTVIYTSANPTGRLEFAPLPDANGNATITVSVSDGVSTNSRLFNVTVTAVNDPPVLSSFTNREIAEDTTATIPFYVNDLETSPDQLILQVSSSNLELVDETGLRIMGAGTNRTLLVTPLPDQSGGVSTITITVKDGSNAMTTATFDLTVRPVNDPPAISGLADLMIPRDSGAMQVDFTVSDLESLPSSLAVTAVSSNQALVPDANIMLSGDGANRRLTFTPASHATGTVVITVKVKDDGSGGSGTNQTTGAFTVQVVDASLALRIERVGANAVISWPTNNAMSWILEGTTNISLPGSWSNSGVTPVVTADRYVVTNALTGAARFYRLKKP